MRGAALTADRYSEIIVCIFHNLFDFSVHLLSHFTSFEMQKL